jgi:type IV pilus assembly protein PilQ
MSKGATMSNQRKKIFLAFAALGSLALLAGCAGTKKVAPPKPAYDMDHWKTVAEQSKGHSPTQSKKIISIKEYRKQIKQAEKKAQPKPLPTRKVSLRMRNADVTSILRALALDAGVDILVKDDIKAVTSVDFNARPWDEVFLSLLKSYGLTYAWEGDIIRVLTLEDMKQALEAETVQRKQSEQELAIKSAEPLSTVVIAIDYADAKALKDNLQAFLPKEKDGKDTLSSVKVDEHSNSLIIQASREDIEKLIPVIESIDKPTPQVLIQGNIVETTKEVARDLGIQWGGIREISNGKDNLWITPGAGTSTSSTSGSSGATASAITPGTNPVAGGYIPASGASGLSSQGFGVDFPVSTSAIQAAGGLGTLGLMYGQIGGNILDMQLQALQSEGKINILSSPSITTLDNQKASTESGEKVPYVSTASSGGTTTQTVNFVDAVLKLEITPHVIDGKYLKMKIIVKKDEVDTTRAVEGNPYIINKQTETTLVVRDGETIVISGLSKITNSSSNSGVPGLKDIPGLGWLFKGESKDDISDEVLIFITPHILPPAATAENSSAPGDVQKK